MSIKAFTPYIFFNGQAEQAIALYERAFGLKVESMQRYGDMPVSPEMCPPENLKRIANAVLKVGKTMLMVGDTPVDQPRGTAQVEVAVDFTEVHEMERSFGTLAERGQVHAPIHDAPWGAKFGSVADEFGIHWMFTCDITRVP